MPGSNRCWKSSFGLLRAQEKPQINPSRCEQAMENGAFSSSFSMESKPCRFATDTSNPRRPRGDAKRIALPVSGDDPKAKAVVMKLIHINDLGFDAVDRGSLDEPTWYACVYGTDHISEGGTPRSQQSCRKRALQFQATEKNSRNLRETCLEPRRFRKVLRKIGAVTKLTMVTTPFHYRSRRFSRQLSFQPTFALRSILPNRRRSVWLRHSDDSRRWS